VIAFLLVADLHGHQVRLATAQLAKNNHARARRVDLSLFLQDLVRTPGIVDPDGGVSTVVSRR
jgi:hypothetical protein